MLFEQLDHFIKSNKNLNRTEYLKFYLVEFGDTYVMTKHTRKEKQQI